MLILTLFHERFWQLKKLILSFTYVFNAGTTGIPGAQTGSLAAGMGAQVVNRRMNAIKTNHPKDMIGPNMGKFYGILLIAEFMIVDKIKDIIFSISLLTWLRSKV